jgi:thiol-disulfide isomerase/thioredoxin
MARFLPRAAALAVAGIVTAAAAEAHIKAWTAKSTPSLSASDLRGGKLDLKDYRGRVVVVNFWATWCVPCRDELPSLQKLRAMMQGKPFEVITVNYGEFPAKIEPYVTQQEIALPVLLDTQKEIAKDWKVGGLPMTFVIDAKGRARYWVFGERDWSRGESLKLVEKLIAEGARARH